MTLVAPVAPRWVFGYGSLIWRPDFEFTDRRICEVRGWTRRFWQGSPDHRGTAAQPGRVVTLIEAPSAVCVGAAYRVPDAALNQVLDYLGVREAAGYERLDVDIFGQGDDGQSFGAGITYVAGPGNPSFLGPAPLAAMVRHIQQCHGPSGANAEYVLELAAALSGLGVDEPHIAELAARLREDAA
ncbi:MAG: cation transport protein ChaC [Myxococcota bacterium]